MARRLPLAQLSRDGSRRELDRPRQREGGEHCPGVGELMITSELPGARRQQIVGDCALAGLRRPERSVLPAGADPFVAHVGDGEDPAEVQLGQPVPLVVGVGEVGNRLPRRDVVVLDDVTDRRGEGDHGPIAGVGTACGDLLDHRT